MNHKEQHFFEFGPFRLDTTEGVLIREGKPVHLTPKALKLLLVLVQNGNHLVDKDELMREVWPDTIVEETNLAGNIHTLRQILNEGSNETYIETIPKRGYRFAAEVREVHGVDLLRQAVSASEPVTNQRSKSFVNIDGLIASGETTRSKRLVSLLLGAILMLGGLAAAAIYFWGRENPSPAERNPQITSIAVLPLKNLSGDASQEYFADGMTAALINELAKIGALKVISRQSIMQYRDSTKTMPEIARELNVDAVLEGSVLKSNDRVRITTQLIRAATDEHLWTDSYDRDLPDVLTLQREIARGVANEIRIKLTPQEQTRLASAQPINPAAHEAYLKGLYCLNQAIDELNPIESERLHKKSIEYFEQAINFDPNSALAYSALASSYHWLASMNFPQFFPKAKEAALKALALDESVAEAHGALAYTMWRHEWDFAGAKKEFERAQELAPNAYSWGYGQFLSTIGRHEEALRRFRLAQDLNPLTIYLKISVGRANLDARQYDQAIAQFLSVIDLDPNFFDAHRGLGTAYMLKGQHEQGIAEYEKALEFSDEIPYRANLAWAYAMAGKRSEAMKILEGLKDPSRRHSVSHVTLARIYSALGEKDLGMAQLEKAFSKRQDLLWLNVDPTFDGLRSDPRFNDLLRRVGFPP